jgi:UDPglucose--hexose-1-phosphate uridylyltransferase
VSPPEVHDEPRPEVRIDQLTGLRTILARARAERPIEFVNEREEARSEDCPFCEGREDRTPPETWADRPGGGEPNGPGWRVRAVPNLYPAVAGESEPAEEDGESGISAGGDPLRAAARGSEPDMFRAMPATGRHEVIIHSPKHRASLAALDDQELATAVSGWRTRMRDLSEGASYLQLIVNEGYEAGASLEHSHAQLYSLDFVPAAIARERERLAAYRERTQGGDLLGAIGAEEVRRGERLVAIDDDAMLICPWASRSPFELRILPRDPAPRFEEGDTGVGMLHKALDALAARFDGVPQFNLWVVTAPRGAEHFSWHLDLAPRIGIRAGFEQSTAVELNIFPPERAAAELRDALG